LVTSQELVGGKPRSITNGKWGRSKTYSGKDSTEERKKMRDSGLFSKAYSGTRQGGGNCAEIKLVLENLLSLFLIRDIWRKAKEHHPGGKSKGKVPSELKAEEGGRKLELESRGTDQLKP